ncbi:MAG: alpha-L-arabinofuranosidase C-terminal domain-containing protein [Chthonomonadales bacterium]
MCIRSIIFASMSLLPTLACAQTGPIDITVRTKESGPRVPASLYGVFFEEINHSGDGGIYAELIRNRDFEEGDSAAGWTSISAGGATATFTLTRENPLNNVSTRSVKLTTTGRTAGISNEGYWGIPVKEGAEYKLALFARKEKSGPSELRVTLENRAGKVLAEETIGGLRETWKQFKTVLHSSEEETDARLVLRPTKSGTLYLDFVSLFPEETFKGRPNGLRADLAKRVAEMSPAFVRFPGGCFVEGDNIKNRFIWKNTIGDISARPGHLNEVWNYRSTDGLGYHEYLQMCEDVHAEALFVINCGLSHKDVIPMNELQTYIDDAMDAIEYARGPANSKWGAVRAKKGHAAPFKMKYIEIGNENGMFGGYGGTRAQYIERYKPFYDAIKAKYPDIVTIADVQVPHPMEMIDEHYYNTPEWFLMNADRYDKYARTGPKIYVGEYAVTTNAGLGNLHAAVSEAAFMAGMERNSDMVKMASYAPLFANVKDRKWNPDAIGFDGTRSYGTPSYYVQQMFAQNRADVVLPTEVKGTSSGYTAKGAVGLATWITQAEFRNAEVIQGGRTVLNSSLSATSPEWRTVSGNWSYQDGAIRQTGNGEGSRIVAGDPNWTDYTFTCQARKIGGAEGFLIMVHVTGNDDYTWLNIGGWGNSQHAAEKSIGGGKIMLGQPARGKIETGKWYDIKVEVEGKRIRCYIDGKMILDVMDRSIPTFHLTSGRSEKTHEIIIKAANASDKPQVTKLHLDCTISNKGTALVLTGSNGKDENTIVEPEKVAPKKMAIENAKSEMEYTFPSNSVTVLRFKEVRK